MRDFMIDTKTINMRMVLAALGGSGVDRLYQQLGNELGVILTFHHISPEPEPAFAPNTHLTINPDFLQTVIDLLRKRGFEFVTMDEAQRRIANPRRGRRFAAFTPSKSSALKNINLKSISSLSFGHKNNAF